MARAKWCIDEVYDVAEQFRERCLIGDDSLCAPGSKLWMPEHVREAGSLVGIGGAETGSLIAKLETQLEGSSEAAIRVAAEILCIVLLPETDTSGETKRSHVETILALAEGGTSVPPELIAAFGSGVANFGAAKAFRAAYMRFVARMSDRVKRMPAAERRAVLSDPWRTRELVLDVRTSTDALIANSLLHVLFPEQFEYMVSETHRGKLLRTFAGAPGVAEAGNDDEKIGRIRQLASSSGRFDLDLYEDPFQRVWKDDATPRWSETVAWARRLYGRDDFDANEREYKRAVAARVAAAKDSLLADDADWLSKLRSAFGGQNNLTSWRAVDTFLRWCGDDVLAARRLLASLWGEDDEQAALHAFLDGLPIEAARGAGARLSLASFLLLARDPERFPFYKAGVYTDVRRLVGVESDSAMEIDAETRYRPEALAARLGVDGRRVRAFLRETFPRADEEHGSDWHLTAEQATLVVERFSPEADPAGAEATYADWIALLDELRLRMLAAGTTIRDRLDAQGIGWWLAQGPIPNDWPAADRAAFEAFRSGASTSAAPVIAPIDPKPSTALTSLPPATPELAASLHLPKAWLQSVLDLLAEKQQLILYGPPGTGKTYLAQRLARHIADAGGSLQLVQFHPSYTYEDFFEGYRPRSGDGGALSFELVPGALREIASAAEEHPESPHLLIIDEINRGNIAKIFGELYFLLEYRDAAIRLQYSSNGSEFRLPPNLFIVGTMNTADRSIALIDTALRRRFFFVGLLPTREPIRQLLPAWLAEHGLPPEAGELLDRLNREIDDEEFAMGPSYFMTADGRPPDLERIWSHSIMPLLEERYYGTGRDLEQSFGLAALRKRIAAEADAVSSEADDDHA